MMICCNCGNTMDDNALFCPECGFSIETDPETAEKPLADDNGIKDTNRQEDFKPTERYDPQEFTALNTDDAVAEEQPSFSLNIEGEEIAPKNKKRGFLIGGIVFAVAVILACAIIFWPYITGFFNNTFTPPEKLQENVYANSINKVFDGEYDLIEDLKSLDLSHMGYTGEVKITVDPTVTSLASSMYGLDFSWFKSANIDYDISVNDSMAKVDLSGKLNDTDVVSIEQVMDMQTNEQWISVPDYFSSVLYYKSEPSTDIYGVQQASMYEQIQSMETAISMLPSSSTLETLLVRYLGVFMSGFSEVEKSSEAVTVEGISQNLTVLTAEMEQEELINTLLDILDTMKDDAELKAVIEDYEVIIGREGLYEDFLDAVAYYKENPEAFFGGKTPDSATLTTYLNGKSEIVGIAVAVSSDGQDSEQIHWVCVQNGNKFAIRTTISSEIVSTVSGIISVPFLQGDLMVEGSGSVDNHKLNAEFDVCMSGIKSVTIDISNFVSAKDGISGNFKIIPSKEMLQSVLYEYNVDQSLSALISSFNPYIELNISGNLKDIALDAALIVSESKKMISISFTAKSKTPDNISLPSGKIVQSLPFDQALFALEKLRRNLAAAGVPHEFVNSLLLGMSQGSISFN